MTSLTTPLLVNVASAKDWPAAYERLRAAPHWPEQAVALLPEIDEDLKGRRRWLRPPVRHAASHANVRGERVRGLASGRQAVGDEPRGRQTLRGYRQHAPGCAMLCRNHGGVRRALADGWWDWTLDPIVAARAAYRASIDPANQEEAKRLCGGPAGLEASPVLDDWVIDDWLIDDGNAHGVSSEEVRDGLIARIHRARSKG